MRLAPVESVHVRRYREMDILSDVRSSVKPDEVAVGPTGVRYSYNAVKHPATADTEAYWSCNQYWFPDGEYDMVCNGRLPHPGIDWNDQPELHSIFRRAQHRRTDDLYNLAYRCKRTSSSVDTWAAYIDALDGWNSAVSATAATFSVVIPDIPDTP